MVDLKEYEVWKPLKRPQDAKVYPMMELPKDPGSKWGFSFLGKSHDVYAKDHGRVGER
jgi:hypothetical protein